MPELQICLLGSFQICWDFAPVSSSAWRNPFAAKLLKLALLRRVGGVSAEEAVRLVGSGMVRADLAPALEHVRRVLQPNAALSFDEQGVVRFRPGPRCWIDVDCLLDHYQSGLAAAARGEMLPAILAFQEADALYQGDLLEDLQEPWVLPARRELEEIYTDVLDRLAEGHSVLTRYQDAVGFCHKALARDPLREATYQRMMVYFYYLGDLSGAREAYAACLHAFQQAGRPVTEETRQLWGRLCRSELPASPGAAAAPARDPARKRPAT